MGNVSCLFAEIEQPEHECHGVVWRRGKRKRGTNKLNRVGDPIKAQWKRLQTDVAKNGPVAFVKGFVRVMTSLANQFWECLGLGLDTRLHSIKKVLE
jgi:hypothetical protein